MNGNRKQLQAFPASFHLVLHGLAREQEKKVVLRKAKGELYKFPKRRRRGGQKKKPTFP